MCSSDLSELTAAFLWAQLRKAETITRARRLAWERYHEAFAGWEAGGLVRRPRIPDDRVHNAHLYWLLLPSRSARTAALESFALRGVQAIFHYVPLHDSPAGRRYGRMGSSLSVTDDVAARLIRLPLHAGLTLEEQDRVIEAVRAICLCLGRDGRLT